MAIDWKNDFSYMVIVPVQMDRLSGTSRRIIIDWRGIPLAVPHRFDLISANGHECG